MADAKEVKVEVKKEKGHDEEQARAAGAAG